jgi:hypothetical protein
MIKSRRIGLAGYVVLMKEKRTACMIFVGTPEGKRPVRRPKSVWENSVKIGLKRYGMSWRRLGLSGSG